MLDYETLTFGVEEFPKELVDQLAGTVNAEEFFGQPRGTLLFGGDGVFYRSHRDWNVENDGSPVSGPGLPFLYGDFSGLSALVGVGCVERQ